MDAGGGGTVAMYMANRNITTLDAGVPVLSMHAPFEVVSKLDCYETYKGWPPSTGRSDDRPSETDCGPRGDCPISGSLPFSRHFAHHGGQMPWDIPCFPQKIFRRFGCIGDKSMLRWSTLKDI